ncbi:MAG: DUF2066 domain-containing protein [Methylococcaceae bacterium]
MLLRVAVLFWMLMSQSVQAVDVKGLYEVDVLAMSQSLADRDNAILHALEEVLGRVMVGVNVSADPVVQRVLAKPNDYVREYQYALAQTTDRYNSQARTLRVLFDEQKLQAQLKHSALGLWNEIRPETLVWLVVEEQGMRQFFNAEKMPLLQDALTQRTQHQGLPFLLPLMDMQEQTQLSVTEMLSPYPQPILTASARYDVVSVLVGLLVNNNGCWTTEWTHYFDQRVRQWQGECKPLKQAVMVGVQGTYSGLSDYYAVKPDNNLSH